MYKLYDIDCCWSIDTTNNFIKCESGKTGGAPVPGRYKGVKLRSGDGAEVHILNLSPNQYGWG